MDSAIGMGSLELHKRYGGEDHLHGAPIDPQLPILAYGATCPEPYKVVAFADILHLVPTNRTLISPSERADVPLGHQKSYSYKATTLEDGRQHVEFVNRPSDDHSMIVHYVVDAGNVAPTYSVFVGRGEVISSAIYGFVLGLLIKLVASSWQWLLRRRDRAGELQTEPAGVTRPTT